MIKLETHLIIYSAVAVLLMCCLALGIGFIPQGRYGLINGGGGTYGIIASLFQFPQGILHQFAPDGSTAIPAHGIVMSGTVVFGISFLAGTIAPLKLQVELRPASASFNGVPTATGGVFILTQKSFVTVTGLADGSYHWQVRFMNALTGAVSGWQAFGIRKSRYHSPPRSR